MNQNNEMFVENVTILKYSFNENGQTRYAFEVLDKFDEPDEAKRLDLMIKKSKDLESTLKDYKQLWIKNTVIV